ncbi:MAG: glycosyltransferase family 1 protein [Parcubacteria group bacterium]
MRIAIDARMYGPEQCTGIGTYIQKLTDNIFKIDKENEFVVFLREPEFSKFIEPNERVKKVLVASRWYSYAEQFKLPFQFGKQKFDLIHYPHFNSPIIFNRKSVCTIHDITPLFFPGHRMSSTVRRIGYKTVFSSTLHKARQIIAVSESTKAGIVEHFNIKPEKIRVIYNGVDERFGIIENRGIINETKIKYGIDKPFVFFVSVWRSHKNIEGLVKAFNIAKKKYGIPHQLVIGGREDLHYTGVRQEINDSPFKNDIITPGYIDYNDLPSLYNAADLFVIPSFIEGFGLTAIEAQKCGCAVASSNTSSLPEVLNNSALFFDPNNSEEMVEQIYKILNDSELKNSLIKKGLDNAKRFSWHKCAQETLKIYLEK